MRLLTLLFPLLFAGMAYAQPGCNAGPNGCGQLTYPASQSQTLASAATITPTSYVVTISGTAAIATINLPFGFSSSVNGCLDLIATGAWTTTTGGNIQAAMTAVANTNYRACWSGTKWLIK